MWKLLLLLLLLDDVAFSILLESRFFRFDGILVIVLVNAVGSRTITAIETDDVVGTKAEQRNGTDELARQEYELFRRACRGH